MTDGTVVELLEQIVVAGVGLTTRAFADAEPRLELTFPQWRVLLILGDRPDGATVSEVARRIGVTVPATSRQLRRLDRRGLIRIGPDERDRRAARAILTTAGDQVRDAILRSRRRRIAERVADIRVTDATLRKLAQIADALSEYR